MKRKDNRGIAIASTLFIMALLSVVGVTVLTLSLSQTRQSFYQERRVQSYYLARSGAESVAKFIMHNPSRAYEFIAAGISEPNGHFSSGTFTVQALPGAYSDQLIIRGTGTVREVVNTATIVLTKPDGATLIDKAIYTGQALNISGMKVNGDVQSGGEINYSTNGSNAFYGDALPNSPRVIEVDWPDTPPDHSSFNIEVKNQEFDLSSSYNFGIIEVAQNGVINVNAGSNIIQIFVDEFSIDNILNINATTGGRVEIYVRGTMTVKTKGVINNSRPEYLFIYLADDETAGSTDPRFIIQANMVLNGYVVGPNATMEVQSSQSTINGAIISNLIQKNENNGPNGEVNYFPLPEGFSLGDIIYEYRVVQWQ